MLRARVLSSHLAYEKTDDITSASLVQRHTAAHDTDQEGHTKHLQLQEVTLPLDAALACCRLLRARPPSACARQGALAYCPCRHTRSRPETKRWPREHNTTSSDTPGQRGQPTIGRSALYRNRQGQQASNSCFTAEAAKGKKTMQFCDIYCSIELTQANRMRHIFLTTSRTWSMNRCISHQ